MSDDSLVTISEASQILGVSEPALRQWTDEGKIKAFVTPGGHRRYLRSELKRFVSSHQKTLGIKDLVTRLEDTTVAHREIATAFLQTAPWFNKLGEDSQKQFGQLGRSLISLIIKCIAEPARRDETMGMIKELGFNYGETTSKLGMPLTDSVHAFIQHREPIMGVITELMKRRESFNHRILEAIPRVNQAMDEALISLVAAYQQNKSFSPSAEQGDGK